jgi:hypothetical protein
MREFEPPEQRLQRTIIGLKIILQALSQIVHNKRVMSDISNTMKKRERLQTKWQQEKTYKRDVQGTDTELCRTDRAVSEDRVLEHE